MGTGLSLLPAYPGNPSTRFLPGLPGYPPVRVLRALVPLEGARGTRE